MMTMYFADQLNFHSEKISILTPSLSVAVTAPTLFPDVVDSLTENW